MKKVLSLVFVAIMIASLLVVPADARGYTLSVPKTVSGHNLNSYGLRTLNVYQTDIPPVIDGWVKADVYDDRGLPTGEIRNEYPGPNDGMTDRVTVKGETEDGYYNHGLWMSSHSAGSQSSYSGGLDFTGYVAEQDVPEAVETYLTYDDEYFYFAVVYRKVPAQSSALVTGRLSYITLDTRMNFIQSDNPVEINGSVAWNRYNINTDSTIATRQTASTVYAYNASSSTKSGRQIRQIIDGKDTTHYLNYYVTETGTSWGSTAGTSTEYKKQANFCYSINVLRDTFKDERGATRHYWDITFEGRMPLGDVLRISDVEYEDGSPLDYVPEWGAWGTSLRYFATKTATSTAPNGAEVVVAYDEPIVAQTMLPACGMAYTSANSRVANYEFHNTVQSAFATASGATTTSFNYLLNPVHFLGFYDGGEFDMHAFYGSGVDSSSSIATSSTRATRRKDVNMAEFDGSASRVIGVSSRASSNTSDNVIWLIPVIAVMVVCACGALAVVFLGKKKKNDR